jgi:formamidopyrimidine-DNA glycosylase
MPELPDVAVYIEALDRRIAGRVLEQVRVRGPFLLRTVDPPLATVHGCRVEKLRRVGKRIAIGLEGDLWLVIHLMIAGRLHWRKQGAAVNGRQMLAGFDFDNGTLVLTEAGSERRAGLFVISGEAGLAKLDAGGIEPLDASPDHFARVLRRNNHTLKRALTDPHLFSGIGNAYSDEILHRAGLSPVALTQRLTDEEVSRLYDATRSTLHVWIERLRSEAGDKFPEKVTAFRPDMAVHGRYKLPCPACGTAVQRIRYAANETNYCPRCQTGGRLLADRSLSRLLREDWPRRIEDIE